MLVEIAPESSEEWAAVDAYLEHEKAGLAVAVLGAWRPLAVAPTAGCRALEGKRLEVVWRTESFHSLVNWI